MDFLSYLRVGVDDSDLSKTDKSLDAFARSGEEAQKRINTSMGGVTNSMRRAADATKISAQRMERQTRQAVNNLTYQLTDIGQMLAVGQSPFILMMQQGEQTAGAMRDLARTGGVIRGLGAAFATILSPVSLATFALIGGGAALVQWGMRALDAGGSAAKLDDDLKNLTSTVSEYISLRSQSSDVFASGFKQSRIEIEATSQAMRDLIAITKIEALNSVIQLNESLAASATNAQWLKGQMGEVGELINVETVLQGNITIWKQNREVVREFIKDLESLTNGGTLDEQYAAAIRLRDAFKENVDVSGQLTEEQIAFWKNLTLSIQQLELLDAANKQSTLSLRELFKEETDLVKLRIQQGQSILQSITTRVSAAYSVLEAETRARVEGEKILQNYVQQQALQQAIAQYGRDSAAAREAEWAIEEETLRTRLESLNVSSALTEEIVASARAAFDASAGADAVAGNLNNAANEALRLRDALGAADRALANIGVDVQRKIARLRAQNTALQTGQNAAVAGAVALERQKVAEQTQALVIGGLSLDQAIEQTSEVRDQVDEYGEVLSLNKNLEEQHRKNEAAAKKAASAGSSAAKKAAKEAEREAKRQEKEFERQAEQYARAINAPLVSAITGASQAFGEFFTGSIDGLDDLGDALLDSVKSSISQAISFAIANPILLELGIGGVSLPGAIGGAAQQAAAQQVAGGGLLNLGGLASGSGLFGGVLAGAKASLGLGGFSSAGLFNISANAATAAATGVGGFAASVGAALPVIGLAAAAISFFSTKTKILDTGVKVTASNLDVMIDSFKVVEKKKFFGLSKKVSTELEALEGEVADGLRSVVVQARSGVIEAAEFLNAGTEAFEDFVTSVSVSTKDMSDEEAKAAVIEALQDVGDEFAALVPGLKDFSLEGEGAYTTLQRLVNDVTGLNTSLKLFGQTALPLSVQLAGSVSEMVQALGGLEQFSQRTQFLFENLYTEQQQEARLTELAQERLVDVFGELNLAIPKTHSAFLELINSQNLTSEKGRDVYSSLLSVSDAFVQVRGSAQDVASALQNERESALAVLEARNQATRNAYSEAEQSLRTAFTAEADRVNALYDSQVEAAQAALDASQALSTSVTQEISERQNTISSIIDALQSALDSRIGLTSEEQRSTFAEATRYLRQAIVDGIQDPEQLDRALNAVANPSKLLFESFGDYAQQYNVNSNTIEELLANNKEALSTEDRILLSTQRQVSLLESGFNAQIAAIDAARELELNKLDEQLAALLGIDTSVLSLAEAIKLFKNAKAAVQELPATASDPTSFPDGSFASRLNNVFNEALGRDIRAGGLDYYYGQLINGRSEEAIFNEVRTSPEADRYRSTNGYPAFAAGGQHFGGDRIVGEGGPEIEMTGPSRIVNTQTTMEILSRTERGTREAIDEMIEQLMAIKSQNTENRGDFRDLVNIVRSWNLNGSPPEREEAPVVGT